MSKGWMLSVAAVLVAGGLTFAGQQAKTQTWSGVITNDMCGAKDASSAKAECTKTCVKEHGAKYALYNAASNKIYILDPQSEAEGHEGHTVLVKGTLDGDTIHVQSLTMAKGS
jgi:hypothetical protein